MTHDKTYDATHQVAYFDHSGHHARVSWAGVLAGLVAGLVTLFCLMLLGAAIGVWTLAGDQVPAAQNLAIGSAIWLLFSLACSSFVGGLTAARSARYLSRSHSRLNGFMAGSLMVLTTFFFLFNGITGLVRNAVGMAGNAAGTVVSAAGSALGGAAGAVQDAGGIRQTLAQVGLGDEYDQLMGGLNRQELSEIISARVPELSDRQVNAATGVVYAQVRSAVSDVEGNLSDPSALPSVVEQEARQVQQNLQGQDFLNRLQARGLTPDQAREVQVVVNQRVEEWRSDVQSQWQGLQARAAELRDDAARVATGATWITLGVVGLMLGMATLGGAAGSGWRGDEGLVVEKVHRRASVGHPVDQTI